MRHLLWLSSLIIVVMKQPPARIRRIRGLLPEYRMKEEGAENEESTSRRV